MNWRIIMHNKVIIERKMKQMTKNKATPFRQKGNANRTRCHQSCEQSNLNQEGHCLLTHQAGTGTSLDWAAEVSTLDGCCGGARPWRTALSIQCSSQGEMESL